LNVIGHESSPVDVIYDDEEDGHAANDIEKIEVLFMWLHGGLERSD
jgi:hypothetical protein